MKRLYLLTAIAVAIATTVACQRSSYATVKVYNPDEGLALEFTISYSSSLADTSGIEGFTPGTYEIEVDPKGDHIEAVVQKTSLDTHELKVELSYKGAIEDADSSTAQLWPIYVKADID
jgi:hypothetical protein